MVKQKVQVKNLIYKINASKSQNKSIFVPSFVHLLCEAVLRVQFLWDMHERRKVMIQEHYDNKATESEEHEPVPEQVMNIDHYVNTETQHKQR